MTRRKYNTDELAFIQSNSHKFSQHELTERFNQQFNANQSISSIRGICHRNGWKTNKKNKSCFKPGNIPTNTRPIGSTRTTINGYTQIKTKNGWEYKHRIIFEAHYGSLSKTERVIFKDNNKQNFDINNLMKATRAQQGVINRLGLNKFTGEAKEVAKNIATLKITFSEKLKHAQ